MVYIPTVDNQGCAAASKDTQQLVYLWLSHNLPSRASVLIMVVLGGGLGIINCCPTTPDAYSLLYG